MYLEETLHIAKHELASLADDDGNEEEDGVPLQPAPSQQRDAKQQQPPLNANNDASSGSGEAEVYLSDAAKDTSFWSLIKQRDIMVAATCYSIIGMTSDSIEEVFPLWLLLSVPVGMQP